ncbi:helix-turn-helix domain-containing protein [Mesorhizobium australicum]|uniref:Homeodomain-like domain-containing protein n=1 Tax=Mesorhizobium australicum TaxID=536018 RepID=A0A1X7NWT5_9HYPH|nr:helix-turn-helix domain-containing protein [Mesorhizobium australicum]SMH42248.1 Homeodomain-like domain-containing protein [Mesorhizobium australicum]
MTHDPDRSWFSPLLNRIADVAGVRAALMLGREKGCQTVYIPRRFGPQHWLPKLVGDDAAAALAKEFGGSKIDIPPALVGQKRKRRAAIAEMTENGYSIARITRALGVAKSTVKDHRRRLRGDEDDGPQGKLF